MIKSLDILRWHLSEQNIPQQGHVLPGGWWEKLLARGQKDCWRGGALLALLIGKLLIDFSSFLHANEKTVSREHDMLIKCTPARTRRGRLSSRERDQAQQNCHRLLRREDYQTSSRSRFPFPRLNAETA